MDPATIRAFRICDFAEAHVPEKPRDVVEAQRGCRDAVTPEPRQTLSTVCATRLLVRGSTEKHW
jgi:hypothetical protein